MPTHQPSLTSLCNDGPVTVTAPPVDRAVLQLLADPVRLQLVSLLAVEQLCTCHLVEATGASQSNVSNHLRALRQAGLVATEPAGRFTYYRLVPEALEALGQALSGLAAQAQAAGAVKRPCA